MDKLSGFGLYSRFWVFGLMDMGMEMELYGDGREKERERGGARVKASLATEGESLVRQGMTPTIK